MISATDREMAVKLIEEAVSSGAACAKACECLGITERTYYRWQKQKSSTGFCEDGRPSADHSNPPNRISDEFLASSFSSFLFFFWESLSSLLRRAASLAIPPLAFIHRTCQRCFEKLLERSIKSAEYISYEDYRIR